MRNNHSAFSERQWETRPTAICGRQNVKMGVKVPCKEKSTLVSRRKEAGLLKDNSLVYDDITLQMNVIYTK